MNCAQVRRAISTASPAPPAPDVRRHLEGCGECRRFAERWDSLATALGSPRCDALPDAGFAARVAAALPAQSEPLAWALTRLFPATAALALLLLGWCLVATPGPSELTEGIGTNDPLVWVAQEGEGT